MSEKVPQHVAIVMDGNGRWAESRGLPRFEGHRAGVTAVKKIVGYCLEQGIAILSLFAFSSENWLRPEQEVQFLMELFVQALEQELEELKQNGVRLCFIGGRGALSESLQQEMARAEAYTGQNDKLRLNVAINYSGKEDILHATQVISAQVAEGKLAPEQINDALFSQSLYTQGLPEPDLYVRTSGEKRISNFFLWQLAYTELYFAEVHWPDFTPDQLTNAIADFNSRERRFGKTSKQLEETSHV